jgi:lipopolysaccharide biosynthesis glycosyltransferase
MIAVSFPADSRGQCHTATVIASILRRSKRQMQFRVYTHGFRLDPIDASSSASEIKPHVIREEKNEGEYTSTVFTELESVQSAPDSERCLVMSYDQLVLCDLEPYFNIDFEGNLFLARICHPNNAPRRPGDSRGRYFNKRRSAVTCPDFYMGPMMNLATMRKERTFEKIVRAQSLFGQDKEMAIASVIGSRVKGVDRKWNLIPEQDRLADYTSLGNRSSLEDSSEPLRWVNDLPEAVIRWSGASKPWISSNGVWRSDLWESEETSWEALRRGWWVKPKAVQIGLADETFEAGETDVSALAKRGWKVTVISDPALGHRKREKPFPDVHWHSPAQARRWKPDWVLGAEMVRIGPGEDVLCWLSRVEPLPTCLVLRGPVKRSVVAAVRRLGYGRIAKVKRYRWPRGGPAPSILEYATFDGEPFAVEIGEDLYLQTTSRQTPWTDLGAPGK